MGDFFHGWRRKIGVVTLVLACMFTGGWIHSDVWYAWVKLDGRQQSYAVSSHLGRLEFLRVQYNEGSHTLRGGLCWSSGDISDMFSNDREREVFDHINIEWRQDWAGCHFGTGTLNDKGVEHHHCEEWIFPYWFFVFPLTLLSAYLLLNKPCKSNQKKSDEPVPVEEA